MTSAALLAVLVACAGMAGLARRVAAARGGLVPTSHATALRFPQGKSAELGESAKLGHFRLTDKDYSDADDHAKACTTEFGPRFRVADWDTDLDTLADHEIEGVVDELGIDTTFNKKRYFVEKAGKQHDGGTRAFFFERHDGHPPSNWLVHAKLGDITLGSWFGISGRVLCTSAPAVPEEAAAGADLASCGRIPASHVFDVQWSGDPGATAQDCSRFAAPFNPRRGHVAVDRERDFFELSASKDGLYTLRQFGPDGVVKNTLPDGKVALASAEMIFYVIDDWFGTLITRREHKDGDAASFGALTRSPSPKLLSQYCEANEKAEPADDCLMVCKSVQHRERRDCEDAGISCENACAPAGSASCSSECQKTGRACELNVSKGFARCTEGCA